MKKNCFNNRLFLVVAGVLLLACREQHSTHVDHTSNRSVDSVPENHVSDLNAAIMSGVSTIEPASGMKIFSVELNGVAAYDRRNFTTISSRVAGRIEKLMVKYNFQPIKKGQAIMEIYSPDLAAAQRELLYAARSGDGKLLKGAKLRLKLLGMRDQELNQVMITGSVMYRIPVYSGTGGYVYEPLPENNEESNMPFTLREGQYVKAGQPLLNVYEDNNLVAEFAVPADLSGHISKGQKIMISPQDGNNLEPATIGLPEPVYRNGVPFSLIRIYLGQKKYTAGTILTAHLPLVLQEGWWLPRKAVWSSGVSAVVFRAGDKGFTPVQVQKGVELNGVVQIMTDLSGWKVASDAAFMVDGDSFISPLK